MEISPKEREIMIINIGDTVYVEDHSDIDNIELVKGVVLRYEKNEHYARSGSMESCSEGWVIRVGGTDDLPQVIRSLPEFIHPVKTKRLTVEWAIRYDENTYHDIEIPEDCKDVDAFIAKVVDDIAQGVTGLEPDYQMMDVSEVYIVGIYDQDWNELYAV